MKIIKGILKVILLILAFLIVNESVQVNEASAAVECSCTVMNPTKGCYADATGSQCAPEGTASCWEYHRNCKNYVE